MKKHKYISGIGMEYYWYGSMYIRMQSSTTTLPPYALIQTTQTFNTEIEFKELEARKVLKEIDYGDFLIAYQRAKLILDASVNPNPPKTKENKIAAQWNRIEDKLPDTSNQWDGLRSDKILIHSKEGTVDLALMYQLENSYHFYVDDTEIKEVTHWAEIKLP